MSKFIFSSITNELAINEYKRLFKTYLYHISNKNEFLSQLKTLIINFQKEKPSTILIQNQNINSLLVEAEDILEKYIGHNVLFEFNKNIIVNKESVYDSQNSVFQNIIFGLSADLKAANESSKQTWTYKIDFLKKIYYCLLNDGLHPNILKRDAKKYGRYNYLIEHYFKNKSKVTEYRILLSLETLKQDYLSPYEQKLPVKINGKLIPFKDIYSIRITSTLLLDDEISLFARKNNFDWNEKVKDELNFIYKCKDETEHFHQNPFLLDTLQISNNQQISFISEERILELKRIQNPSFDLVRLIKLCEELNDAYQLKNYISTSILIRAIIDHIPPIFKYNNFREFANNYSEGTKSFKKAMLNLEISLRNIADNNVHSQIREKEILPTINQSNFLVELDFLLSEIVRKMK